MVNNHLKLWPLYAESRKHNPNCKSMACETKNVRFVHSNVLYIVFSKLPTRCGLFNRPKVKWQTIQVHYYPTLCVVIWHC